MNPFKLYNRIGLVIACLTGFAAQAQDASSTLPIPRPVESQSEVKAHLGVRAGGANPGSDFDNAFEYGVEYGFQPYIPYGLIFELSGYNSDNSGAGEDLNRSKLMVKGNYNFGGDIPVIKESYLGAGAGAVMDTVDSTSYGRLGLSLQGGFDVPLTASGTLRSGSYSVGADLRYLFVSNSAPDDFNVSGVMKYWF